MADGGVRTYRMRTALRPLKAPSAMWLIELCPRRRVWRSPSTARLPSSRRVRLLYDRFLEGGREGGSETHTARRDGRVEDGGEGVDSNVMCDEWKELIEHRWARQRRTGASRPVEGLLAT